MPAAADNQPARLTEIPKCLPVVFVMAIIIGLYVIYLGWHCLPLLQLDKDAGMRDNEAKARGTWQLVSFLVLSTMLNICYVRSIVTDPGDIPDDKEWIYFGEGAEDQGIQGIHETKRTGERRHCKWCNKYKPDRCHHCRVCRNCILKMDHHCPWIYNCVGYKNHKFFFLLLFYTFLCTQLICWTMYESMKISVEEDNDFFHMFVLLFGETLCGFLTFLVTSFFGFHIWLMFKGMSTIEFCESKGKNKGYSSVYDRGVFGNMQEVLGKNMWLWLLPIEDYAGNGLTFDCEGSRLSNAFDVGRTIRSTIERRGRDGAGAGLLDDEHLGEPSAGLAIDGAENLVQRQGANNI